MPLYEWFMPLLHLDARPDLVQCIKLCETDHGPRVGSDPPAAPRAEAVEQAEVAIMEKALATGPPCPRSACARLRERVGRAFVLPRGLRFARGEGRANTEAAWRGYAFFCIDGHTCGNPVRVVAGGTHPAASRRESMFERRQHFLAEYDWIRTGLMFEPRGHDMMSGSILYPPTRADCDVGILFIETSGCLPMCGHGTIGTVTIALENGLIQPREPGLLRLDTPAGLVEARYEQNGPYVESVRITNVPRSSTEDYEVEVEGLGKVTVDVAYGGNFYAIVEPQPHFSELADVNPSDILRWSPSCARRSMRVRDRASRKPGHRPADHVLWTGDATTGGTPATPCSTATRRSTVRPAARGPRPAWRIWRRAAAEGGRRLRPREHHRLDIRRTHRGRAKVGNHDAIIPSIEGWARVTGINTIVIDDRDPFAHGFQVVDR